LVAVAVNVRVGRGVRVGEAVRLGMAVRVGLPVAVKFGLRVEVGVRVSVGVDVGVREGVRVAVLVAVGVLDKSIIANCAFRVSAALVASELRFAVGDGFLGVDEAVTVCVAVRAGVKVGATVAGSVDA
jgi:hypothetical protein